jgi:release factor glutamine methyltransferase
MKESVGETWTVQKLIHWTTTHFEAKKISSARLDAELLLAHTLKCRRLDLYLNFEKPLKPDELLTFRELIKRRALSEPVAYLTGFQDFYGRTFKVSNHTLIPRPETEQVVEEALSFAKNSMAKEFKILDVATGSGCIGVTLAIELKTHFEKIKVTGLDISQDAITIARENAAELGVSSETDFLISDFSNLSKDSALLKETKPFDLIVSNPPYIAKNMSSGLSPDVSLYEPHQALFGGDQGYELMEKWIPIMGDILAPLGKLVLEIGFDQAEVVEKILSQQKDFIEIEIKKDFSGHHRIATALKRGL